MAKNLVIVESPAKAGTIEKYLGKSDFVVKATMGHLRDLPKSQLGIDVESGFEPHYITVRGKTALVKELAKMASEARQVFLATDPDREGEAIAWHVATLLNIDPQEAYRVEFNEITKSAVTEAIRHARNIDNAMVDAQQARRVLDRIVGYKLSPLLWKKVRRGLSAGRVQSVAVRLICDRERGIEAFQVTEYWTVRAFLLKQDAGAEVEAELIRIDGKKAEIPDAETAESIRAQLDGADFTVGEVKRRDRQRKPYPPFTTSTLQQDASHKLGFSAKKTMVLAQQLYEAGRITYMRTDSTRVSNVAQTEAREWIAEKLGAAYLPAQPHQYAKKSAQDAHEAIRPTEPRVSADALPTGISRDQQRLYDLIWKRFIASQMKAAVYDTVSAEIAAGRFAFRATGSILKFRGFMAVYADSAESGTGQETDRELPPLQTDEILKSREIRLAQHFTEPPPRFTEAALIKLMEEKGIGRPSTYAPTIETIQARGYVIRTEKKFQPTPLGMLVTDLLKEYFPEIVDVDFTARMEGDLDAVAQGGVDWRKLMQEFYVPFMDTIARAEKEAARVRVPQEITDIACENCGAPMAIKQGRFGSFLGCTNFPACKTTKPLVKEIGVPCPLCEKPVVERKSKAGRVFYGCSDYPTCTFVSWNKPTADPCPVCGSFMIERRQKGQTTAAECSNSECPTRGGQNRAATFSAGRRIPKGKAAEGDKRPKKAAGIADGKATTNIAPAVKGKAAAKSVKPAAKAKAAAKTKPAAAKRKTAKK